MPKKLESYFIIIIIIIISSSSSNSSSSSSSYSNNNNNNMDSLSDMKWMQKVLSSWAFFFMPASWRKVLPTLKETLLISANSFRKHFYKSTKDIALRWRQTLQNGNPEHLKKCSTSLVKTKQIKTTVRFQVRMAKIKNSGGIRYWKG